ncbi:MAG: hypothetical protein II825_02845 [Paludibacteraceae bacterium]|nr:hypothetical protein [Paludibacteraceae bacterium]
MKKILLVLVAMLTMVFTGCKIENSTITVAVEDTAGTPVSGQYVFYADYASIIVDAVLPSPDELISGVEDYWEYEKTNAQGVATITIPMAVSKMKYRFMVYDAGSSSDPWKYKDVEVHRGVNDEVKLVISSSK